MSGRIRISEKHGVNPSLLVCPICGEDSGVALVGRLPNDAAAPRKMMDREPCAKCKEIMKTAVFLIEVEDQGANVDMSAPVRTGNLLGMSEAWVRRALDEPMRSEVLKSRRAYIERSTGQAMGLPFGKETP